MVDSHHTVHCQVLAPALLINDGPFEFISLEAAREESKVASLNWPMIDKEAYPIVEAYALRTIVVERAERLRFHTV